MKSTSDGITTAGALHLLDYIDELEARPEPQELALCESERLILREGVPYVFRKLDGCKRCAELAEAYADEDPPDARCPQKGGSARRDIV